MHHGQKKNQGFTLIELSIVLVIIGLIVGGVLVGQDLIKAAAVRAQVAQIEKFNQAANTFRVKYGYLPGDIPDPYASNFGFQARGTNPGQGDGNGIIEGIQNTGNSGRVEHEGEIPTFWVDLSTAQLISGGFNAASPTSSPPSDIGGAGLALYLPLAKIGTTNYLYVYSLNGINYFGLSAVTLILANSNNGDTYGNPGITVSQAYAIDNKVDDGLPQSGSIIAQYLYSSSYWTGNSAVTASASTCYDTTSGLYSLTQNNGAGFNCGLSFKMQGAAR